MAKTCDTCGRWSNGQCVADRLCWTCEDKTKRLWVAKGQELTMEMVRLIRSWWISECEGPLDLCITCEVLINCQKDEVGAWLQEQAARLKGEG